MKAMNDAVNEIKKDKIHGASYLTDKALKVIKDTIETCRACNREEFLQEISLLAQRLSECRPAMVSISNCSSRFINELQTQYAQNLDLFSLRESSLAIVQNITHEFACAQILAIEKGAGIIADQDTIMTCSFSSTMIKTIAQALNQNKLFRILIARSQEAPDDIAYGDKLALELGRGVDCLVFSDDDIRKKVKQADKIIVGADAILLDGSLLNGYPTADLALAAKEAGIPFYTICDSSKFLHRDIPEAIEKGFNLVPSHLITGIISEKGIFNPSQVYPT